MKKFNNEGFPYISCQENSKMKNVFDSKDASSYIERIKNLSSNSSAQWGKMSVGQMLAHCNVTYEMALTEQYPKAKGFKKIMLKLFVKPSVVGNKPYRKNSPTAPEFKITEEKEFDKEQERLINYISETQTLGINYFDGKVSNSFGKLNQKEWNVMFAKHLDHHLEQFGV